eukprot:TRINITY_DN3392_c0_g3_i1.p1 TRINITY_DN3392_c0_g3~~TRINITY_DN3392_c0_g3_i1.p1  ORF type:complete len:458 (+),score=80.41 TRINITY_DN3392_c0_g3_i1:69-1442(+)
MREVMFLRELNGHENIIRLRDIMRAENDKDLYLVFDYMETDLHAVIRANILEDIHRRYVIYQVVKGLVYMHSGDLIHRDLKPSNVLLNADVTVRIADFGLARSVAPDAGEGGAPVMTEYVATRWYRAPEILLGSKTYTKAVDVWSLGCILGEMINGRALFPGTSTLNQIERILELNGKPKAEEIEALDSPLAWNILESLSSVKRRGFSAFFPNAEEDALDFLRRSLTFSPVKRMTIEEALRHRYLAQFYGTEDEPRRKSPVAIPLDDNVRLKLHQYRETLYADIKERKRELRKRLHDEYLAAVCTEALPPQLLEPVKMRREPQKETYSRKPSAKKQQQSPQETRNTTAVLVTEGNSLKASPIGPHRLQTSSGNNLPNGKMVVVQRQGSQFGLPGRSPTAHGQGSLSPAARFQTKTPKAPPAAQGFFGNDPRMVKRNSIQQPRSGKGLSPSNRIVQKR